MADNQIDLEQLERSTNTEEGWEEVQTAEAEHEAQPSEPQTSVEQESAEPAKQAEPATPAPVEQGQAAGIPDDVLKILEETPFKSVPDVVKAYKSLQSESTKLHEKVKPHEQLLNDISTDANLRQFIDQAVQLYRNPSLAQAYAQPQQQGIAPNPQNYDFSTYEGIQKFQEDTIQHAQKAAFETVNQRMSGWEQQQSLEKAKYEFKTKHPEADPESVLKFVQERKNNWTLEDAWKIQNFDTVRTQAYEQARKEVLSKTQEAAKNSPVGSAPADKPAVSHNDVVSHVQRYGLESANKKWGQDKVKSAIQKFTEENE